MARKTQIEMFKSTKLAYGGELLKTREGRSGPRPIDSRNSMHLVLRSTQAKGSWSFRNPKNANKIRQIINKFSTKYGVRIYSLANVGNHLHFQIKLSNRLTYKPFIRAITAAIAMAVTGHSRWNKDSQIQKFWDYRPFTRVVRSMSGFLNLRDYIQINKWEGFGGNRRQAEFFVKLRRGAEVFGSRLRREYG